MDDVLKYRAGFALLAAFSSLCVGYTVVGSALIVLAGLLAIADAIRDRA